MLSDGKATLLSVGLYDDAQLQLVTVQTTVRRSSPEHEAAAYRYIPVTLPLH